MSSYETKPFMRCHQLTEHQSLTRAKAFYDDISKRRTIRDFSFEPVSRQVIEHCLMAAGSAPSGANHQPWHFVVIENPEIKREIRLAAEAEERAFYAEKAPHEWLEALAPLGTDDQKPFLEIAPYLIAIFGQKRGGPKEGDDRKNYYVTESVGIATGILLTALHQAGLVTLTHTPSPMTFLNEICQRPDSEKPFLLLVVGHPAQDAVIPIAALNKKPLSAISTWL